MTTTNNEALIRTAKAKALKFETRREVIEWKRLEGNDGIKIDAISLDGGYYAIDPRETLKLAEAGVEFYYLHTMHNDDGKEVIVTIPAF